MEITSVTAVDARKISEINASINYQQAIKFIDVLIERAAQNGKFDISYTTDISNTSLYKLKTYYQNKSFHVAISLLDKSISISW